MYPSTIVIKKCKKNVLGTLTQMVEHLPSKHEALSQKIPALQKKKKEKELNTIEIIFPQHHMS
jgi:hypothetical protein